jgi:hypothetical protein
MALMTTKWLSEDAWLRDETAIPNEERPKLVYEAPVGET